MSPQISRRTHVSSAGLQNASLFSSGFWFFLWNTTQLSRSLSSVGAASVSLPAGARMDEGAEARPDPESWAAPRAPSIPRQTSQCNLQTTGPQETVSPPDPRSPMPWGLLALSQATSDFLL